MYGAYRDYVVDNRNLRVLDIYMRHYANRAYCESSLLFDGKHLRQGFGNDNIIF